MNDIGSRLDEVREILDIRNKSDFAQIIGVSSQAYYNYINGNRSPKKIFYKLNNLFNINTEWLETGEGQMFLDGGASKGTYFNNQQLDHGKNITTQDNNQELQLLKKLEIDNNFDDELIDLAVSKIKNLDNKSKRKIYLKLRLAIEEEI
jgi:DNA-binding XRE family transcriptional regulator